MPLAPGEAKCVSRCKALHRSREVEQNRQAAAERAAAREVGIAGDPNRVLMLVLLSEASSLPS